MSFYNEGMFQRLRLNYAPKDKERMDGTAKAIPRILQFGEAQPFRTRFVKRKTVPFPGSCVMRRLCVDTMPDPQKGA